MTVFHVDPTQVAQASAMVRASADSIRAQVQAMMGHLDALQGSWSGAASAQFSAAAANWRSTQVIVEQSLDEIGIQLAAAASTYSDAEAGAAALFAG
ncbi:WXG100 family type VII secretion target [Gleimia europaea]|uniref:ESAT-6-like protein n=1 Tax=Gleimia europaea ACS-120-V-Col10b TaxID=883069 RepID=A0A9W5RFL0_9ACTO|nr:WXG100 family type VII secretion target [Gleimia europaea]EPD31613.1 WXG100 family type VII secretion target [Gleimia europaea ACS-120-V-Col10b]